MSEVRINREKVAVSQVHYYEPMSTCPLHTTVLLLNLGGCMTKGTWDGKQRGWAGWAGAPFVPEGLMDEAIRLDRLAEEQVASFQQAQP